MTSPIGFGLCILRLYWWHILYCFSFLFFGVRSGHIWKRGWSSKVWLATKIQKSSWIGWTSHSIKSTPKGLSTLEMSPFSGSNMWSWDIHSSSIPPKKYNCCMKGEIALKEQCVFHVFHTRFCCIVSHLICDSIWKKKNNIFWATLKWLLYELQLLMPGLIFLHLRLPLGSDAGPQQRWHIRGWDGKSCSLNRLPNWQDVFGVSREENEARCVCVCVWRSVAGLY